MTNASSSAADKAEDDCQESLSTIIPTASFPEIPHNAVIVGFCAVSGKYAHPSLDGSFLADFSAFNYLLKGAGAHQLWVSGTSEQELLDMIESDAKLHPGLLHGNPDLDRRLVFSRDLLEHQELSPFICADNLAPMELLKAVLKEAHRIAKFDKTPRPVLLFLFGHASESLGLYVQYGLEKSRHMPWSGGPRQSNEVCRLTLGDVDVVRDPAVPLTVIVPPMVGPKSFHGGWERHPLSATEIYRAKGKEDKGKRGGSFTLVDLRYRWGQLQTVKYTNKHAASPSLVAQYDSAFRRHKVVLASMLIDTCHGDWKESSSGRLQEQIRRYTKGQCGGLLEEKAIEGMVLGRVRQTDIVDALVRTFNLHRPQGQSCVDWDRIEWHKQQSKHGQIQRIQDVSKVMEKYGFGPGLLESSTHGWGRYHSYMKASLYESKISLFTLMVIVHKSQILVAKYQKEEDKMMNTNEWKDESSANESEANVS